MRCGLTLLQANKTKELLDEGWNVVPQKGPMKPGSTSILKHPTTGELVRVAGDGTIIRVDNKD